MKNDRSNMTICQHPLQQIKMPHVNRVPQIPIEPSSPSHDQPYSHNLMHHLTCTDLGTHSKSKVFS